jgi:hypothetical protein
VGVLDGTVVVLDGTVEVLDGTVVVLDGTVVVLDGTVVVLDGTVVVLDGTVVVLDGTVEVLDGTVVLEDGGTELVADPFVEGPDLGAALAWFTDTTERTGSTSAAATTGTTSCQTRRRPNVPGPEGSSIRLSSFAMSLARTWRPSGAAGACPRSSHGRRDTMSPPMW